MTVIMDGATGIHEPRVACGQEQGDQAGSIAGTGAAARAPGQVHLK
jgi:hypothetical protein